MKKLIGHIYEEDGKEIIERIPRKRSLWIEEDTYPIYAKKIKCPNCGHFFQISKIINVAEKDCYTYCGYCGNKNIVEEKECEIPF